MQSSLSRIRNSNLLHIRRRFKNLVCFIPRPKPPFGGVMTPGGHAFRSINYSCRKLSSKVHLGIRHLEIGHEVGQKDREPDDAVHWKSMSPKSRHVSKKQRGRSDSNWINCIWEGFNQTRFHCSTNSETSHCTFLLSKGHISGGVIALGLLGHVAHTLKLEEFLFHRGFFFEIWSKGRQKQFFTLMDPWGDEIEEEFRNDLLKLRKVHCKRE